MKRCVMAGDGGGVRAAPVEMDDELRTVEVRGSDGRKYRVAGGYRQMPVDLGAYVHITRMVGARADGGEALLGHLLSLQYLNGAGLEGTAGTLVEIKSYLGAGIKVIVDGKVVFSWAKLDGGSSRTSAPVRKKAGRKAATAAATTPARAKLTPRSASRAVRVVSDDVEFE